MKLYFFFSIFITLFAIQSPLLSQNNGSRFGSQIEVREDNRDDDDDLYNGNRLKNRTSYSSSPSSLQAQSTLINNVPEKKLERTLSILKPDAVRNRHIGDIVSRFEDKGLRIVGIKMIKLRKEQAGQFYDIHHNRPFFNDLVEFMSSGPIVVMVLEGENAVSKNRGLMGATDPNQAEQGSIRADFAESVSHNTVHGSDSVESANKEIPFFFSSDELYSGY